MSVDSAGSGVHLGGSCGRWSLHLQVLHAEGNVEVLFFCKHHGRKKSLIITGYSSSNWDTKTALPFPKAPGMTDLGFIIV